MEPRTQKQLIVIAVSLVLGIIGVTTTIGWVKVDGHEAIVRQHMTRGVLRATTGDENEVWRDGTHFYFPAFMWDNHKYDVGRQKLTMDFMTEAQAQPWGLPVNEGAEYPRLQLAVGEDGGQQAWIGSSIIYRIGHRLENDIPVFDRALLVSLHISGNGKNYEDVILKRIWQEVVTSIATPQEPLAIYSGDGFEIFRQEVDARLRHHPTLTSVGIIVESVIMYPIRLDPNYEKEISAKQMAIQTKLKEKELQLAADASALRVKSEEQSNVERVAQRAEAEKQAQMKKAEAEKYQQMQAAEAERYRQEQEAKGVLAMRLAEADGANKMTEAMYGGVAGDRRYRVEHAQRQAESLRGMLSGVSVITDKALVQLVQDPSVGTVKVTVPAEQ